MDTTIQFRIKKDLSTLLERKILKLKGTLIANSYTDIIHFKDDGEEFYINYFVTELSKKEEVRAFIEGLLKDDLLDSSITIVES